MARIRHRLALALAVTALAAMGGASTASAANLFGTIGPDTLFGTALADVVNGVGGNDFLVGLGGHDLVIGGTGHDRLIGDPFGLGNDMLYGGPGNDRLDGNHGLDRLEGGIDQDRLDGGGGSDRLIGGAGNDQIRGVGDQGARDLIDCGAGLDAVTADSNDRFVNGVNPATPAQAGCEQVVIVP